MEEGEDINSDKTRSNSAFHSSFEGFSVPTKEDSVISKLVELVVSLFILSILPIPNCDATSATVNRFDLNAIPDGDDDVDDDGEGVEKMVGSRRTDRIVYMSRTTGSRLGPPTKGDDSDYKKEDVERARAREKESVRVVVWW